MRLAARLARSLCAPLLLAGFAAAGATGFDAAEVERIVAHGPWPPAPARDPSNRVSGRPEAIVFGERLFASPSLSGTGSVACVTCHTSWRDFSDGRPRAFGIESGTRNTTALRNVAQQRWFGWDGANDTLWGQSIRPLLDTREMRSSAQHVAQVVRADARLVALYRDAFGQALPLDDEALLVDIAKALAAYQETLASGRTPFDDLRDALARGDAAQAARYPADARRGLRLFVGKAQCAGCHTGALFSDGRFHRSPIRSARPDGLPDAGRADGLRAWLVSRYTRHGPFSDTTDAPPAAPGDTVPGAFRTPGLRDVGATGPYMHDGSVANLCDTIQPHAGDTTTQPLTRDERRDLVAFLRTLSVRPDPPFVEPSTYVCR